MREAVDRAYTDSFHKLVPLAAMLLASPWGADDLVHDAFEVALKRALKDPSCLTKPLEPWLRRIVVNLAKNRRRTLRRERSRWETMNRGALAEEMSSDHETLGLYEALQRLPVKMRTCLVLQVYGHSVPEIAALVGCRRKTVDNHLWKARIRLRETLETTPDAVGDAADNSRMVP